MSASDSTRPRPALLAQTLVAIVIASLAIRLMPFTLLARTMRARLAGTRQRPASFDTIIAQRRALEAWGCRLPWRVQCFEQGLAAHWLLGLRGHESTLNYGATHEAARLAAHVWVQSGEHDVIGCEVAEDFVVLSRFTNGSTS